MRQLEYSVVIPVFNGAQYLGEAIESALGQTIVPRQVIVVDDGSTDESAEVARGFGPALKLIQQPNAGIGAARNAAIPLVETQNLAFLDADDTWVPRKAEWQARAFEAEPELDMVFGFVQPFLTNDAPPGVQAAANLEPAAGYLAGAMMIRTEAFLRAGLFATDVRLGEFVDWYARAERLELRARMLSEVVLHRRIHANNTGLRERDRRTDYLSVVRKAMAERRKDETRL